MIEYLVEAERPLAGSSPGFDEVAMRQTCALIADHADAIAARTLGRGRARGDQHTGG